MDTTITESDRDAIEQFLADGGLTIPKAQARTYEEEIAFISAVLAAVLRRAPLNKGIPLNEPREPADLFRAGHGLCFDRSRAIEKILDHAGFDVRHVSVYALEGRSALESLLTPNIPSHAVSEVRTQHGWMVVDSNVHFIGLSADRIPVSMAQLQADAGNGHLEFAAPFNETLPHEFSEPFTYIIGLYSRHGRFYPPYNPVPDVHWGQWLQNY